MRTLTLTMSSILLSVLMMFTSCSKEMESMNNLDSGSMTKYDSEKIISDIKYQLSRVELNARAPKINPSNPNNLFDSYGKYFGNMLTSLSLDEKQNPSNTISEYEAKIINYVNNNPISVMPSQIQGQSSVLYGLLIDLICNVGFNGDLALSTEKLKTLENIISKSRNLSSVEIENLLALTSFYKYTMASIGDNGLYALGKSISLSRAGCFQAAMRASLHSGLSTIVDNTILNDWQGAPFLSSFEAWGTLTASPAIAIYSLADSIVAGINC
tara:strand:- start:885 stop:1694 length:810 start_codon:yes stop_codon:yes gene_type:complete